MPRGSSRVEDHGGNHVVQAQDTGEGHGLPVSARNGRPAACAPRGAAARLGDPGQGSGLIDEDQTLGIEFGLGCKPSLAPRGDVWLFLLGCVGHFLISRGVAVQAAPDSTGGDGGAMLYAQ